MSERLELLKNNEEISSFNGLPEEIVKYENENNHNFGNTFIFSGVEMSYYGFDVYIGKIDKVFFLGVMNPAEGVKYTFFKTKKEFEIYILTEIEEEDRVSFLNILKEISK